MRCVRFFFVAILVLAMSSVLFGNECSLKGLKGTAVLVEDIRSKQNKLAVKRTGVTRGKLQRELKEHLRNSCIRILRPWSDEYEAMGYPDLYLKVTIVSDDEAIVCASSMDLSILQ